MKTSYRLEKICPALDFIRAGTPLVAVPIIPIVQFRTVISNLQVLIKIQTIFYQKGFPQ